jgi:hypothetical protein
MVKFFDPVMTLDAASSLLTFRSVSAHFRSVTIWDPSLVLCFGFVVKQTFLGVVGPLAFAWLGFE